MLSHTHLFVLGPHPIHFSEVCSLPYTFVCVGTPSHTLLWCLFSPIHICLCWDSLPCTFMGFCASHRDYFHWCKDVSTYMFLVFVPSCVIFISIRNFEVFQSCTHYIRRKCVWEGSPLSLEMLCMVWKVQKSMYNRKPKEYVLERDSTTVGERTNHTHVYWRVHRMVPTHENNLYGREQTI